MKITEREKDIILAGLRLKLERIENGIRNLEIMKDTESNLYKDFQEDKKTTQNLIKTFSL